MNKFKVGDTVRRINSGAISARVGQVATVIAVDSNSGNIAVKYDGHFRDDPSWAKGGETWMSRNAEIVAMASPIERYRQAKERLGAAASASTSAYRAQFAASIDLTAAQDEYNAVLTEMLAYIENGGGA